MQFWHVAEVLAPVALENLPDMQLRHVAAVLAAVAAEYLPAKQSSQGALPDTALYLPGRHWAQLPAIPSYLYF